jgi:hypothetical protein
MSFAAENAAEADFAERRTAQSPKLLLLNERR